MKAIKTFCFFVVQFVWGAPQSIIGLLLLLKYSKCEKSFYHGALLVLHDGAFGGISLGPFIFVNKSRGEKWINEVKVHEYGHAIQSLIFGPLYLFVIGLPSIVWCNAKKYRKLREEGGVSYYKFYPEKYANVLGQKVTGDIAPKN